jgi:hypothetical protein
LRYFEEAAEQPEASEQINADQAVPVFLFSGKTDQRADHQVEQYRQQKNAGQQQ